MTYEIVELGEAEVAIEFVAVATEPEPVLGEFDPSVAPYVEFNE